MNNLNNNQLILLALLVSFVTSIATGIVTVTLLDQAPPAVTQTINRVVERTVEVVTPPAKTTQPAMVTQTVVVKEEEFITKAAEKNAPNVIEIGRLKKRTRIGGIGKPLVEEFELELLGTAFALNSSFAVSQNKALGDTEGLVLKTAGNHLYKTDIAMQDAVSGLMLFKIGEQMQSVAGLTINSEKAYTFISVAFAGTDAIQIGQTAIALGAHEGVLLSLGVVSQIKTKGGITTDDGTQIPKEIVSIHTTIDANSRYAGGPLININGEMTGVNVITENNEQLTIPVYAVTALLKQTETKKSE